MKREGEGEKIPIPFPLSPNPLPFSTPATPQAAQTHVTLFPCNESLGHLWLRKVATVSVRMVGTLWGLLVPSMLVYKIW